MKKKDRIKLCLHYEELHDAVNKIAHAVIFRPKTQQEYDKIYDKIHSRVDKVKETIDDMFDAFELEETYFKEVCDEHIGCYSYPNCDLSPTGCTVMYGSDAEQFGHKD